MVSSTPWYQWIFSGIGVVVVSWFGAWAYRRYRRAPVPEKHLESTSQVKISDSTVVGPVAGRDISIGTFVQHAVTSESTTDEYRGTPTTDEIAAAIKRVPLYLQASVSSSYSGLKVRWQAEMSSIYRLADGQIDVSLNTSGRPPYIVLKVKLDDYPILKTVRGGEPVEVMGTIDWVQENGLVHLKDVRLKFLPQ